MLFFVLLFCCRLKKSKGRSERIGEKKRGGRGRNETREREKKPPPTVFLTVACLGGDLERVVGDGVHIRVGVLGAALALASGELDLVGAGAEGLLLRGLGLEGQAHQVDLLDDGNELLDAHNVAQKVARNLLQLGGQHAAQLAASADDAHVDDDVEQLVDGLANGLHAEGAQVQADLVVGGGGDGGVLQLEQRRLGGKGGASQQEDGHEGEDDLVHCSTFLSLSLADGVSVCLVFVSRP